MRDLAGKVQLAIERDEPTMLGIGSPRQPAQRRGRGAPEEQKGEATRGRGGRRRAAAEQRCRQNGTRHQPHQDAAETVLISMVCSPLTKRCVPVTFTLLST